MTYRESDLLLTFPPDWVVRKYDATAAYRSLAGHGLKGVDFICLLPDGRLWLIEVKNYTTRRKRGKVYAAKLRSPEDLSAHLTRKFHDSERLLRIVAESFRRRWYRRWQLAYQRWRGRPFPESNVWFWNEAARRSGGAANPTGGAEGMLVIRLPAKLAKTYGDRVGGVVVSHPTNFSVAVAAEKDGADDGVCLLLTVKASTPRHPPSSSPRGTAAQRGSSDD